MFAGPRFGGFSFGGFGVAAGAPQEATLATPLHHAVESKSVAAVCALLKAGALPNAVDNLGRSPAHYLSVKDCTYVDARELKHAQEQQERDSNFYKACFSRYCEEQRPVLAAAHPSLSPDDVNKRLVGGWRRLPEAGKAKHAPLEVPAPPAPNAGALAIIAALAAAGADFNIADADGFSPLARLVKEAPRAISFSSASACVAEPVLRALLAGGARADCLLGLDEGNNAPPKPTALARLVHFMKPPDSVGLSSHPSALLPGEMDCNEEACVRTLLEYGAVVSGARSGGDSDLVQCAWSRRRWGLARLFLSREAPQPPLRSLLARIQPPRQPQGPFFAGGAFGGLHAPAFPAAPAPAAAAALNENELPPFSQEDLLKCCRLNFVAGIRELLQPAAASPSLDINFAGDGAPQQASPFVVQEVPRTPLEEAVAHDCVEAMNLLLVRLEKKKTRFLHHTMTPKLQTKHT
jgi:hypothetical protein